MMLVSPNAGWRGGGVLNCQKCVNRPLADTDREGHS